MAKRVILGMAAAILATVGLSSARAEEVTRLAGRPGEATLLVRHEPGPGPSVLYVHGATFPSASSIAYRIDGRSWMDDLRARGFDVWAFDFAGYGGSDRPAALRAKGEAPPFGRAVDVVGQVERVAAHLLRTTGRRRLSIVAHSWGTLPASLFATRRPDVVENAGPVRPRGRPAR